MSVLLSSLALPRPVTCSLLCSLEQSWMRTTHLIPIPIPAFRSGQVLSDRGFSQGPSPQQGWTTSGHKFTMWKGKALRLASEIKSIISDSGYWVASVGRGPGPGLLSLQTKAGISGRKPTKCHGPDVQQKLQAQGQVTRTAPPLNMLRDYTALLWAT